MEAGPIFMKARAIAFCCIILVGMIWLVLLSLDLFLRWDVSDHTQRSLTVILIMINTITVIMLPTLLLVRFRMWLDAARMLLLVLGHFGTAIALTVGNAKFKCLNDTPDDDGICGLIDIYILLGSWVIPALLLAYCTCLAILAYQHKRIQGLEEPRKRFDIEEAVSPAAVVPTMAQIPAVPPPLNDQRSSVSIYPPTEDLPDEHLSYELSRPSWPAMGSAGNVTTKMDKGKGKDIGTGSGNIDTASKKSRSPRSSARLSKRLPDMFF